RPSSTLFPYTTLFRSERGDHGSVAIVDHASRPLEIAPLHQRDIQRHLDGLVRERTGVLPLALEPGTGTDRHRQDLLFDLGMRIRSEEHTSELQSRSDL